jgi:hypothetical protein
VVVSPTGGSAVRGAPPAPGAPAAGGEDGSQTLELALLVPFVALLAAGVLLAGLAAAELVLAQAAARDAARVAAVDDDAAATAAAEAVAGRRALRLSADPPAGRRRGGDLVTVEVEVRSEALRRLGVEAWLPARAAMRVEHP